MPSVYFIKEATRRSDQLLLQHPVCLRLLYLQDRIIYQPFPPTLRTRPCHLRTMSAALQTVSSMVQKDTQMGGISSIDQAFDAFLASKTEPPQKRPAPAQPANIEPAKKRDTKWCSACHQHGHIKSNCPKHKADQQATRAEGAQLMVDSLMTIVSLTYPQFIIPSF